MGLDFDPFSFVAALVALFYAVREGRRNVSVALRVVDSRVAAWANAERRGDGTMEVAILTLGVPIDGMGVHLVFNTFPEDGGYGQHPLQFLVDPGFDDAPTRVDAARGSVQRFILDTSKLAPFQREGLTRLVDPHAQNARLSISDRRGRQVAEVLLGGVGDRLRRSVNDTLARVERLTGWGRSNDRRIRRRRLRLEFRGTLMKPMPCVTEDVRRLIAHVRANPRQGPA